MTEVYTLLKLAISKNERDDVKKYLDIVPLEDMSPESTDTLMKNLLIFAHQYNSADSANLILEQFDQLQPNSDRSLSSFTRLFTFPDFPTDVLKWCIVAFNTESYIFVTDELIRFDSAEELLPAYQRATDLYNVTDAETIQSCLDSATSEDNSIAVWFFSDALLKVADLAELQPYVKNFLETEVPIYKELKIPEFKFEAPSIPNVPEAVDLLTAGLENTALIDTEVARIRAELRRTLEFKSEKEIYELVKPTLLNQQYYELKDNIDLFRIMGPVNPEYKADLTLDHICYKYGGHRMFYCTCYEIDYEDDEARSDWFSNNCSICLKRIKSRAHAWRRPRPQGGFRGCFCSKECTENSLTEVDVITSLMLKEMEKSMYKFGVQDRNEDPNDRLPKPLAESRIPTLSEDY